ncbi:hypothetical protein C8R41DRAFT_871555 [Lentinula lateritia]|uniref:Uncharacterized protein n=1 Tax=Lentinula lateritia TaxID=40482 RepID=A0ABQ8UZ75_9AGAR|nr:hypothetical protein C8R41DRAFT_871555 [Lentinula lateritia]
MPTVSHSPLRSQRMQRRRLSPSASLDPGYIFNGKKTPLAKYRVIGKMFGIYWAFTSSRPENIHFPSENTRKTAPSAPRRSILFRERFSSTFRPDNLYTTLVIVEGRRYVVAGTYDQTLRGSNRSLNAVDCPENYKGDIGLCFLGKYQRDRFLKGMPRFDNAMERKRILRKVLQRRIINHGTEFSRLKDLARVRFPYQTVYQDAVFFL